MSKNNHKPPKPANRLLLWFLKDELAEEVLGDLEEKFYSTVAKGSLWRAKINYWYQVFNYLRPFAIKSRSNSNFTTMFKHNILISFRSQRRYKSSFFINLTGLSTGLACSLLIFLWVHDELNVDNFYKKGEQLYEVMLNIPIGSGEILTTDATPGPLVQALTEEMPEVEVALIVSYPMSETNGIISSGDTHVKANELYVGGNFFCVFSFPLIKGSKQNVLSDKSKVLISDEMALKLFGSTENVTGKTIGWDRKNMEGSYIISGVFKNPAANSSLQFDLLFTHDVYYEKYKENLENWGNSNPSTFVVLSEGTDIKLFNDKIRDFIKSKLRESGSEDDLDWAGTLFAQKFSDRYLYNKFDNGVQSGGRISYVKLFSMIAAFILLIACINFMNLSTAKASRRLKEIGVKKVVGADRKSLLAQFMSESVVMAFLSLVVALIIVTVALPWFNRIVGKHITLNTDYRIWLSGFVIALLTGFIAGSYPALYLSKFKPIHVLKGKLSNSIAGAWVRKGLVVFQFTASIILIGVVLIVHNQINFIHTKNLGYNRSNIITFKREGKLNEGLGTFLKEVKKMPGVVAASDFTHNLTGDYGSTTSVEWEGKASGDPILFSNLEVGYGLIELMDFELVAGRSYSSEYGSESSKIIFNEAAIKAMGMENPVGKSIKLWGKDRQIIGVVKDFNFESLYEKVKPCFLLWYPDRQNILVKIKPGMEKETIAKIQNFYQSYNDGLPFEYHFLDDDYDRLYASEQRVATLSRFFAGMAILISCLGLFGLAAFTAERRLKEIGIRKILGAGQIGIIKILSADFTQMVILAIFIAIPLIYLISNHWLRRFAYHINLQWWYFAVAGFTTLLISWITVGIQTIKAAQVNPVECLKDE